MPGLLAVTPPRKTARGREHNSLIVYLTLSGNASLSTAELMQLTNDAANVFYQWPGSLTSALRNAANDINSKLLARNLSVTGSGQQALGLLVLAAIRENQCTLLLSGPTHAVWVTDGQSRHIYDPALSGKGLGSGQSINAYLSQVELRPQDLLVLCAIFPRDWEADLLNERPPASLDASYRKLTFTKGDLNAVLIQAQSGHGTLTLLRPDVSTARHASQPAVPSAVPAPSSAPTQEQLTPPLQEAGAPEAVEAQTSEQLESPVAEAESPISEKELDSLADFAAHMVQPSAYAIPPQPGGLTPAPQEEIRSNGVRGFPASIPRAKPVEQEVQIEENLELEKEPPVEAEPVKPVSRVKPKKRLLRPNAHAEATRQMAKVMVGGIRSGRRVNERFGTSFVGFDPTSENVARCMREIDQDWSGRHGDGERRVDAARQAEQHLREPAFARVVARAHHERAEDFFFG